MCRRFVCPFSGPVRVSCRPFCLSVFSKQGVRKLNSGRYFSRAVRVVVVVVVVGEQRPCA